MGLRCARRSSDGTMDGGARRAGRGTELLEGSLSRAATIRAGTARGRALRWSRRAGPTPREARTPGSGPGSSCVVSGPRTPGAFAQRPVGHPARGSGPRAPGGVEPPAHGGRRCGYGRGSRGPPPRTERVSASKRPGPGAGCAPSRSVRVRAARAARSSAPCPSSCAAARQRRRPAWAPCNPRDRPSARR